jgi:hypothetical protein
LEIPIGTVSDPQMNIPNNHNININMNGDTTIGTSNGTTNGQVSIPTKRRQPSREIIFPSSLDFERVVNLYSIQATRDRVRVSADNNNDEDRHPLQEDRIPLIQSSSDDNTNHIYNTFPSKKFEIPPPPPRSHPASREMSLLSQNPGPLGYTGRSVTRWCLIIMTGLLTGLVSIVIVKCTSAIEAWRSAQIDALWQTDAHSISIFAGYASVNLALAMASAILCIYVAPEAIGSGIPEVKAFLNGVRVKRFTRTRLFVTKIVGTILAVSSGLVIGPEGPLVHIGAILGASCTKLYGLLLRIPPQFLTESIWSFVVTDLSHFSNDGERRDLVSVGAAAGFASAFGAPIGGLLF